MLAVKMKAKAVHNPEQNPPQDIITIRWKEVTVYNEDNSITIKKVAEKINITKKVNESKKLIKTYTAEEKLKEIDRIAKA